MSHQVRSCEKHGYHVGPDRRRYNMRAGVNPQVTMPPMSQQQYDAFQVKMGSHENPVGGFAGCAYEGVPFGLRGVVCQHNMPKYMPSKSSYHGHWVGNVENAFPGPVIQTPGGLSQLMMGGGPGDMTQNPCLEQCSCDNDIDCTCSQMAGDSPGQGCGWVSVNQDCMAPVPGGMYPSLSACEAANYRGSFNPKAK